MLDAGRPCLRADAPVVLTRPSCRRSIDLMLEIHAVELAILLAAVVAMATTLYFIVRLAVGHGSK